MSRVLVLVLVAGLAGAAHADPAHADPAPATPLRWWQQFYVTAGARDLVGLNATGSSTAYGAGYRFERASWGVDLALLDLQAGLGEGMHTVGRATLYRRFAHTRFGTMWAGTGPSYGFVRGWTNTDVPGRSEHGPQWSAVVGWDFARHADVAPFVQLVADVPVFAARDHYDSMDSSLRVVGLELAVGLRF